MTGRPEQAFTETLAAYVQHAHQYRLATRSYENFPNLLPLISNFHMKAPGGPVLDMGAGCGRDSLQLASWGRSVVALDIVAELLLTEPALSRNAQITPVIADARRLPLARRSIAGVLAVSSMLHLSKDDVCQVVLEIGRVLQVGGHVLITVPNVAASGWVRRGAVAAPRWMNELDCDVLSGILDHQGFEVTEVQRGSGIWGAVFARPKNH